MDLDPTEMKTMFDHRPNKLAKEEFRKTKMAKQRNFQ